MKIWYQVDLDDLSNYTRYYWAHSETLSPRPGSSLPGSFPSPTLERPPSSFLGFVFPLAILVFIGIINLALHVQSDRPWFSYVPSLLILAIPVLLLVNLKDRRKLIVLRMLPPESIRAAIGYRELEITETSVISRSFSMFADDGTKRDVVADTIAYSAIEKVITAGRYAFILINANAVVDRIVPESRHTFISFNSVSALIIPHQSVDEGKLEPFLEELQRRLQSTATAPIVK